MGDLTDNLSRKEFECQCGCGTDFVDIGLPGILQACVYAFKVQYPTYDIRISINSGTRCMVHNVRVGGKPADAGKPMSGSMHLYGKAADFYLYDKHSGIHIPDDAVADYLEKTYPDKFGIGRYDGRTHVDNRTNKARWDKRKKK